MATDESNVQELDLFDRESGLARFRENVESFVNIPLVPAGSKIVVDEKALESIWLTEIAKYIPPAVPPEKYAQLKGRLIKHFNQAAVDLPFDASELHDETENTKRTLMMAAPENRNVPKSKDRKMDDYKEWACVRHALVQAGAHLEIVETPPVNNWNLDVFTRDRYLMIGDTAYLPDTETLGIAYDNFRRKVVAEEIRLMEAALQARGVKTVTVKGAFFEGGNVIRHYGSKTIFVGIYEPYYTARAAQKLLSAINNTQGEEWSVQPVPLKNFAQMYHLDTGMSEELPKGEVMLSPLVTDRLTYETICNIVGKDKVIELKNEDAKDMATNMINVGNTIIMTSNCDDVQKQLTTRGYKVVSPADYGQTTFAFGRGGVHCMTNDVPSPARKASGQGAPRS